ncbi:MAG: hypothetical protein HKN43_14485 [Rhodothermales bacterium]|nr:hypothetical protein [Rhodothermales bacterium]
MRFLLLSILIVISSQVAFAQDPASLRPDPNNPVGENLDVPPGWQVRLDQPNPDIVLSANKDSTDIWFVTMTPGWHVTAGPAAIYYHPANVATSDYAVTSTIHLFDPKGRNEGYGVFLGGSDLEGDDQAYTYFLLRNDGKFLIKRRSGSTTSNIVPWTAAESIAVFPEGGGGSTATNTLRVDVSDGLILFFVNDILVRELDADEIQTNGIVGLRINHGLDVHVSDLTVSTD